MKPEFDHPDTETLLLYGQGRLAEDWCQAVEAHIRACASCRLEARRLSGHSGSPSSVDLPSIADVLARLSQRQNALARSDTSNSDLKHRVAVELAPYIGWVAAQRLLSGVADNGENLLSTVEAMLRLFLGKAAAFSLTSRIVDRAILRN